MNPPIRSAAHRDGLVRWLNQGVPDVIGSDHAPHTLEEKAKPYPDSPSGMPGVQTLLPLLLDHVAAGRTTLQRVIDLTSAGPQRVFGLVRSEEHTSELQSLMRISYAVFCLTNKKNKK